jgi:hypothetical protein
MKRVDANVYLFPVITDNGGKYTFLLYLLHIKKGGRRRNEKD